MGALPSLGAAEADGALKLVIVLSRHGVRSPLQTNLVLGKYAAERWPEWKVAPGLLTPHGREQMVQMGSYYRARYVAEGLLTGDAVQDEPLVFFRSNNLPRTMKSARAMAAGLLPGTDEPNLHARAAGQVDALFLPVQAGAATPNRDLAVAAVLGRMGNDPANLTLAYREDLAALQQVLGPVSGQPGKVALLDAPAKVGPGQIDHAVDLRGPIRVAQQATDALLLQYAEGMPMADVGWGRVNSATLTQLLKLHSLYFDVTQRTFYPAQAQASNLADHILKTLQRAAGGPPVPEAFGNSENKLIVLVGHDTNIVNLGGLLGADWYLPGTQANPVLPGGALVFELRSRPPEGRYYVRVLYVSQTLDQIRNLTPLTLAQPPGLAPIFIPGGSEAGPGYDVPFAKFEALLQRVIDPRFVLTGAP